MRRHDSHSPANVKAAAAVLLVLITVAAPAGAVALCPAAGDVSATVASVHDGATFALADGTVVALAGIDPPRRPLGLAADAPWPIGDVARQGLATALAKGAVTLAWSGAAMDRYGRRRAYVFAGGESVAMALLRQGLAQVRWREGEADCFGAFVAVEDPAIEAGLGLWSLPEFRPMAANDPSLAAENGLYRLVEGRVESIGDGSRMTFLDFGRNFRRDFTVMVPQAVAAEMAGAGQPADTLAGRFVRVRGVIEENGGPAVRLNDAAELEVIDDGHHGAVLPPATR